MSRPSIHTDKVILNVPHELAEAIKMVARRQLTSKAEYMRRAVLTQLERDGIRIENLEVA
jgi:hypothetical protein